MLRVVVFREKTEVHSKIYIRLVLTFQKMCNLQLRIRVIGVRKINQYSEKESKLLRLHI